MNLLLKPLLQSLVLAALLSAAGSLAASLARAAGASGEIPDPDPELQRKSFQLPAGWQINLFASDPMISKPIQMNFDPAGRLWVATSSTYPQIKPGQKPEDKIIVLEDTDHDGLADTSSVFADGLLIPTGIAPGDGGAYVSNSTELLHLRDTDGDGRADTTRVLLSGFGTEDTHHILHTFRWGPEGLLYFNQSIYIHSHLETPWGIRRLMGGGIWRLRPETMQLAVFARGWINPWGHQFDRWGQSFVTDGAGGEGINYVVPDASYATADGAARILPGLNPGQPKLCGHEVLSGRHIPPDWVGSIVSNDFRAHRIARFVIADDSAGFSSTRVADLLSTSHAAFRPVDVKMGPDGAIYVADFYNPIINHGEVDFRDPRRDRTHGRIWRITFPARPLVEWPRLAGASVPQLLEALKQPEDWTRAMAKQTLKARGAGEVLPALAAWARGLDPSDPDFEHHRLEALWTYQALDVIQPELLAAVLASKDPHARAAATRVIYHWGERLPESSPALALLSRAIADEHPRVRLEAVCALRRLGGARAVEMAMQAVDKPLDRFLEYALWQTAREREAEWLPEFLAGKIDFGGDVGRAVFALKSSGAPAVKSLMQWLQEGKIPPGHEQEVLAVAAALGGPNELRMVFELALSPDRLQPGQRATLLALLGAAAARRGVRPAGDLPRVSALFGAPEVELRLAALRLAGAWRLEKARPALAALAFAADTALPERQAAAGAIALLGGAAGKELLVELTGESRPIDVRMMAAAALLTADLDLAVERGVAVLCGTPDNADPTPLFDAILGRKEGPAKLAAALAGKSLAAPIAAAGVRSAIGAGRDMQPLVAALSAAGKLEQQPRRLTPAEIAAILAAVPADGDARRGEAVFRRAALQCLNCHAVAGGGGKIGPDLASIGASAPLDYLLESLLDPSKKIKEGFHTTIIATDSGRLHTGLLVRRTDAELLLRDGMGREIAIPAGEVEEQSISPTSLMPLGLVNSLRRDEIVDLLRFLSELGKQGEFQAGKAQLVRNWQALDLASAPAGAFNGRPAALAIDPDPALPWKSAFSTVAGTLPLEELPRVNCGGGQFFSFARFKLDVTTPGKIALALDDPAGLEMWNGAEPISVAKQIVLDLPGGTHSISLAIDPRRRQTPLRVELIGVEGSPGRVSPSSGP